MPDGSYGGVPGGFLLTLDGARVYFACDTALFLDMKLIGSGGLDLAVLPIGDRFTMGPEDSIDAIKLLESEAGGAVPLQHLAADRAGCARPGPSGCGRTRRPSRSCWSRAGRSRCNEVTSDAKRTGKRAA